MTCEKCKYWNGKICTDEVEYVNRDDGEPCCRYHLEAMPAMKAELKRLLFEAVPYIEADIDYNSMAECGDYERARIGRRLLEEIKGALTEGRRFK